MDRLTNCIAVEDLIVGAAYIVAARNFTVAIWDGDRFQGLRHKFGGCFIDGEIHWDQDERYGTAQPLKCLMTEENALYAVEKEFKV